MIQVQQVRQNQYHRERMLPLMVRLFSSMTPKTQRHTKAAPCSAHFLFFSLRKKKDYNEKIEAKRAE